MALCYISWYSWRAFASLMQFWPDGLFRSSLASWSKCQKRSWFFIRLVTNQSSVCFSIVFSPVSDYFMISTFLIFLSFVLFYLTTITENSFQSSVLLILNFQNDKYYPDYFAYYLAFNLVTEFSKLGFVTIFQFSSELLQLSTGSICSTSSLKLEVLFSVVGSDYTLILSLQCLRNYKSFK